MKRGYADTPMGQIHYYTEGEGEPLIISHQTGSARSFWKLIPLLAKEYKVYAPDNLGEGSSDPLPPGAGIPEMAHSYIHMMDALGIKKAHYFGIHTGNKIGAVLGSQWASRFDGLVLCGQTHSIQGDHKDQVSVMGAMSRPLLRQFEPSPDGSHLLKQWANEFSVLSSTWWDINALTQEKLTPDLLQRRKDKALDQLQGRGEVEKYKAIFAFDLAGNMQQIKTKQTLVVEIRVPTEAHLTPQGPRLLKIIPNSRLVTIPNPVGGNSIEVVADQVAASILGFLRDVKASR